MKEITSKDNSIIKHIVKLKEKKYRKEFNEYVIEGAKIVKEAIEEKATIKYVVIDQSSKSNELIEKYLGAYLQNMEYIEVPSNIFKLITDVEKPQGVLAVIERNVKNQEIDYNQDIILALDDIQDPGNLGTIIRTADSVGLNQILISKGTADPYNSKVIRSTMGAIFRVSIIECEDLANTLNEVKENGFKVITTSLGATKSIYELTLNKKAIVIGNEANGVSKEVLSLADETAIIPMIGKTESLNASIATGVILYEYLRQKLY